MSSSVVADQGRLALLRRRWFAWGRRRTYGALGLMWDWRAERRASWLHRDLRERRRRMLSTQ
jgi:hypothetical protein